MRHTAETKAHLSAIRQGSANPFYGRTHTAEFGEDQAARNRMRTGPRDPLPQQIVIPDKALCAYLAGLIDADGSIRFKTDHSTRTKNRRPFVTVYNTSRELIDWLMATLGHGCVAHGNLGREQVLSWTVQGARDVYALLTAIRPWLIIKSADADTALWYLREKYQWA